MPQLNSCKLATSMPDIFCTGSLSASRLQRALRIHHQPKFEVADFSELSTQYLDSLKPSRTQSQDRYGATGTGPSFRKCGVMAHCTVWGQDARQCCHNESPPIKPNMKLRCTNSGPKLFFRAVSRRSVVAKATELHSRLARGSSVACRARLGSGIHLLPTLRDSTRPMPKNKALSTRCGRC